MVSTAQLFFAISLLSVLRREQDIFFFLVNRKREMLEWKEESKNFSYTASFFFLLVP